MPLRILPDIYAPIAKLKIEAQQNRLPILTAEQREGQGGGITTAYEAVRKLPVNPLTGDIYR
jgi:hypothetical protein